MINKYLVRISDPVTNETIVESDSFVESNGQHSTVISRLQPNSNFKGQVFASNEVGVSSASKAVFFRTSEAPPDRPPIIVSASSTGANSVKIAWKVSSLDYLR